MNSDTFPLVIFGGTTEGRLIAEWCPENGMSALYCVATETGRITLPGVRVRAGRLDAEGMTVLLRGAAARLVIDATHPYATGARDSIKNACRETGTNLLRVLRGKSDTAGCEIFENEKEMIRRLSGTEGIIFAATGAKEAELFTKIPDFERRVFFRMLPSVEGLETCLRLGYPANHLIMMYGPFSKELNAAMFSAVNAAVLVTKDSGDAGGFSEKIAAAKELGMKTVLMARPEENESGSVSVAGALEILSKLRDFFP